MSTATVTSKGQVTIPVDVRTSLGLRAGSRLGFVRTAAGHYEIRVETASIRDLKGIVTAPSRPVTLEEMADAVAAGAAEVPDPR